LVDALNPTGYSQVLDELVGGAVTKTYTYGLQRISENQLVGSTWTPTFYGYDGHGNVRFLASSAGAVGNTYQYDAFGMPVAGTGTTLNSYLYSGERWDGNLGLYHLRARYYNQSTGRFETMDPYQGRVFNPGTLHKYIFTGNNPVNWVDTTGRGFAEFSLFQQITAGVTATSLLAGATIGIYLCAAEELKSETTNDGGATVGATNGGGCFEPPHVDQGLPPGAPQPPPPQWPTQWPVPID